MKYPTAHLAETVPDLPAVLEGTRVTTHAELERRIVDAARRLREAGVGPDDRVALLAPNSLEWIVIAHATTRIGAILVPVNTRLATAEILALLEFYIPRVLLIDVQSEAALTGESVWLDRAIYLGDPSDRTRRWWNRIPAASENIGVDVDPECTCTIISTSGTTGKPKGVCLSLANHVAAAEASGLNLGSGPHDRWLINLPLYHVGGLAIIYRAAVSGITMVIHGRFDAQQTVDAVERAGITHMSLVENTLLRLLDAWGERSFPPTLRCALVGGGPVDVELLRRARRLGLPVMPTYGLTEAASQVATLPLDAPATMLSSVGRPLPSCEVEIRDEHGKAVPPRRVDGEISIRGPMVARGYWKSRDTIEPILSDGWFATGDIGVLDAEGYLTVRGRADDMIISGGEKIFPTEIEACLTRIPGIRRAAVVGADDPRWGRVPVAFIEILPGSRLSHVEISVTLTNTLAHCKIPKHFITLKQLPLTASGKIDRRKLAELYRLAGFPRLRE